MKMVIACDSLGGFAKQGQIPWVNEPWFKKDLKWFKKQTMGCSVIMGRTTYGEIREFNPEEFLPGRQSWVVTSSVIDDDSINVVDSIWKVPDTPTRCVIGGERIWREALCDVSDIYMTLVMEGAWNCDKHIPIQYITEHFKVASCVRMEEGLNVFHIHLQRGQQRKRG